MLNINVCYDRVYVVIDKIVNPKHTIYKKLIKRYVFNISIYRCARSNIKITIKLTNNSSMFVFHFSKFILLIAHFSCRGMQNAACTTAVAPTPEFNKITIIINIIYLFINALIILQKTTFYSINLKI